MILSYFNSFPCCWFTSGYFNCLSIDPFLPVPPVVSVPSELMAFAVLLSFAGSISRLNRLYTAIKLAFGLGSVYGEKQLNLVKFKGLCALMKSFDGRRLNFLMSILSMLRSVAETFFGSTTILCDLRYLEPCRSILGI